MYEHSATAYDLLHAGRGKDYRREAASVLARIRDRLPEALSVLDVACGTGLHLAAFAEMGLDVEGVELSEAMIAVARTRVPDVAVHRADMRSFRLPRRFDAVVCLFSAIGYMTDLDQVGAALATMAEHLVDGGVLVVEPWFEPDDWHDGAVYGEGAQDPGLAAARVSRSWREGRESVIEMQWAMATRDRAWSFSEIHRMGLHTTEEQLGVFRAVGLDVIHEEQGLTGRGLFVAQKRGASP